MSGSTLRHELALWQLVARTAGLADTLRGLWPHIERVLPVTRGVLWNVDRERLRAEALAQAPDAELPSPRTLAANRLPELLAWCRGGEPARGSSSALSGFGSPRALCVPLSGEGEATGALMLFGAAAGFSAHSEAAARLLVGPLSAALVSDRRLHELVRVKEAYEADRSALLSRLDRHDISESVVGAEAGLRDVVARVEQVAPTDVPVLIFGETGSGKEVVARTLHGRSRRAHGPMVRVNCGAIPSELIDSELFGHEQGSFTGAVATRKGWFERADGGTLFLDEIGELPLPAQVRLLRVLQDGVLERVGGQRPIQVDVRIVAATHRDLESMVATGAFRQDLWYRVSVFPVRLPPLRERREDIPSLAAHFAHRATKRLGGMAHGLSAQDIALLVSYDWPGNVRELAAVIERAAILGEGKRLEIAAALGTGRAVREPASAPVSSESLAAATTRHIEDALRQSYGRVEGPFGAARALGINPHTLRARMRKLGIDWTRFRAG